jgi:hypothetical protein
MYFLGILIFLSGILLIAIGFAMGSKEKVAKKQILKDAYNLLSLEARKNKANLDKLNDAVLKAKIKNVIDEHVSQYKTNAILEKQAEFHKLLKTMVREFGK